jgi:hypothetical protein
MKQYELINPQYLLINLAMKTSSIQCLLYTSTVLIVCLTACCNKPEEPKARVPVNSFSMHINGWLWKPLEPEGDPCRGTFTCNYSEISGGNPFYIISAYYDPNGKTDADSESLLYMQIMDVNLPGTYALDGSYRNAFDSYIVSRQQPPSLKFYANNPQRSPFTVQVQDIFPLKYSFSKGIKGTFSGTLYNEADPADSLMVEQGQFRFAVVNYHDHCGY